MNTKEPRTPFPTQRSRIGSTTKLYRGDDIEAAYRGAVTHRGQVTRITRGEELFWITDDLGGSRQLLDVTEFDITRL